MTRLFKNIDFGWVRKQFTGTATAVNPLTLLFGMTTAYRAQPYVEGHAKGTSTMGMTIAHRAQPYVRYRRAT